MKTEHDSSGMIGLGHVGIYAKDPASLAEFYRDVMGMQVVGGSVASHPLGPTSFLSRRPGEEPHEIAMFSNPDLAVTATGKSFDLPLVHVWTIQNGKVKRFVNFTDTAKVAEAYTSD